MSLALGLAADIGGTNTRLALVENGRVREDTIVRYSNADYETPEAAIGAYLSEAGTPRCGSAVLAIAAPISGTRIEMTNHNWVFEAGSLSRLLGDARVEFLNDFEALAHSLENLNEGRLVPVQIPAESPPANGTRVVVGAGTGFNAAALYPPRDGGRGTVGTGECGHMTLPVETARHLSLRDYLARGRGRASVERALSGSGLREVYEWHCLEAGQSPGPLSPAEIAAAARARTDPISVATARAWMDILGRVAGDIALVFMALGGVYLTGGVARSLQPFLSEPEFLAAFRAKGRQTGLVSAIPVYLLDDDFAALAGCAARM
ncbi:glucokinase [Pannonibacter carbonis]|uniref:glucokinase n=1 Tax=Pannonibacter carbonis TaxID=2067569 RepID=UPI000D11065C|nr:glucokinase [Pannonibacter carbonis]